MRVRIYVSLKEGVLDPQGKAIGQSLNTLGFSEVTDVHVGKVIALELEGDREQAEERVKQMCERLLVNTVIESYRYEFE